MKITLAFTLDEEKEVATILEAIRLHQPTANIRKSDLHPPFKHIYVSIKNAISARKS